MNTTKDGIEVKPGQKWRDRDKRMNGRTIVITRVEGGFAWFSKGYGHKDGRVGIARMHNKSTGFELVGHGLTNRYADTCEAAAKLFDDLRERLKSDLMHDIGITEQDIAETMPPKP